MENLNDKNTYHLICSGQELIDLWNALNSYMIKLIVDKACEDVKAPIQKMMDDIDKVVHYTSKFKLVNFKEYEKFKEWENRK